MKAKIAKTSIIGQRKETLRNNGFTVFEANQLKTIPTNAPYLTRLIEDRQSLYADYYTKTPNPTMAGWRKEVDKLYLASNWLKTRNPTALQKKSAVWSMIHEYEKLASPDDNWFTSNSARKNIRRMKEDFSKKFDKALFRESMQSKDYKYRGNAIFD